MIVRRLEVKIENKIDHDFLTAGVGVLTLAPEPEMTGHFVKIRIFLGGLVVKEAFDFVPDIVSAEPELSGPLEPYLALDLIYRRIYDKGSKSNTKQILLFGFTV